MPKDAPRTNRSAGVPELLGIDTNKRDDEDRLILGDPTTVCPWCSETAAVTISECGRVAFWHAPTACCNKRYKITRQAELAETQEAHEADRVLRRYRT